MPPNKPRPAYNNPSPIKHSMERRCNAHDYSAPSLYMITLVIENRRPLLGQLISDTEPHIELSPLGTAIFYEEHTKIPKIYPNVEVVKICVMPDHIHMILNVKEDFPPKKNLGTLVNGFKAGCRQAWRRCGGQLGDSLFRTKYNDKILWRKGQLDKWKKYLDDNPRRLDEKRKNPDLFTVMHDIDINDIKCQMVGNKYLLNWPDKEAVIVHRSDSDEDFQKKKAHWLSFAESGGILVSAAIAEREREVFHEAMERGYPLIWLRDNGFPDLYKPSGRSFDACSEGRLLQISPWEYHYDNRTITRDQCLYLNRLAEAIVAD
ncbi:MAG: transposase [Bacteroidales bacterium]|nr:transposase [Bacteroidales bacterium]